MTYYIWNWSLTENSLRALPLLKKSFEKQRPVDVLEDMNASMMVNVAHH